MLLDFLTTSDSSQTTGSFGYFTTESINPWLLLDSVTSSRNTYEYHSGVLQTYNQYEARYTITIRRSRSTRYRAIQNKQFTITQ